MNRWLAKLRAFSIGLTPQSIRYLQILKALTEIGMYLFVFFCFSVTLMFFCYQFFVLFLPFIHYKVLHGWGFYPDEIARIFSYKFPKYMYELYGPEILDIPTELYGYMGFSCMIVTLCYFVVIRHHPLRKDCLGVLAPSLIPYLADPVAAAVESEPQRDASGDGSGTEATGRSRNGRSKRE